MKTAFSRVLQQIRCGESSQIDFTIEDRTYTRLFQPRERLILLGGGHISSALSSIGVFLNFEVIIVDDRPMYAEPVRFPNVTQVICGDYQQALTDLRLTDRDYVALLTRGHRYDAECLRTILVGTEPRYTGMIGSQKRVTILLQLLQDEGYDPDRLARVHAPIGLPINAQTPAEIAIAIAAELVQCRRDGLARRSHSMTLLSEDVDLSLLSFVAEDTSPKSLVLVYGTQGSTPAKSGAMLAVNREEKTVGTIGGGCWENLATQMAIKMIGTGESRTLSVTLDDEVGISDGMACGGRMDLFLVSL